MCCPHVDEHVCFVMGGLVVGVLQSVFGSLCAIGCVCNVDCARLIFSFVGVLDVVEVGCKYSGFVYLYARDGPRTSPLAKTTRPSDPD